MSTKNPTPREQVRSEVQKLLDKLNESPAYLCPKSQIVLRKVWEDLEDKKLCRATRKLIWEAIGHALWNRRDKAIFKDLMRVVRPKKEQAADRRMRVLALQGGFCAEPACGAEATDLYSTPECPEGKGYCRSHRLMHDAPRRTETARQKRHAKLFKHQGKLTDVLLSSPSPL